MFYPKAAGRFSFRLTSASIVPMALPLSAYHFHEISPLFTKCAPLGWFPFANELILLTKRRDSGLYEFNISFYKKAHIFSMLKNNRWLRLFPNFLKAFRSAWTPCFMRYFCTMHNRLFFPRSLKSREVHFKMLHPRISLRTTPTPIGIIPRFLWRDEVACFVRRPVFSFYFNGGK